MRRILVVDDDTATRSGLCELLAAAGYHTTAVASFPEAVERLRGGAIDLLIADIRLGAYNGLQLVVNRPAHVQAIVMSGFSDVVLETEANRYGARYLEKPVRPDELLELVRATLPESRADQTRS